MKHTICFILILCIFSCGVDNHDTKNAGIVQVSKRTDTSNELETKMQWASYLAAMVLEVDEDARTEFSNLITNQNKTIALEDIFTDTEIAASVAPAFKNQFMNYLSFYSLYVCEPGKPEHEHIPVTALPDFECIQYFLDYILVDNCLEYYFPKKLEFSPVLPITSTAHPLSQADFNYGFKRHVKLGETEVSYENIIDPDYVDLNKNIIVTRPIADEECDYSGWGVDFTLFLND